MSVLAIGSSAIVAASQRAYEAIWASPDRIIDGLDLPQLGVVSHREHNDFFSIDIAPNTTAELEPLPGETIEDLRTAVTERMKTLGYTSYPLDQHDDYVHWLHTPSADPRFGPHSASVVVTVPSPGSRGGNDTSRPHVIDAPVIRFEASSD